MAIETIISTLLRDRCQDPGANEHETASKTIDFLTNQQSELGWRVVDQRATGLVDIVCKARILERLAGGEREDVSDQLAAALAADILRLLPYAR